MVLVFTEHGTPHRGVSAQGRPQHTLQRIHTLQNVHNNVHKTSTRRHRREVRWVDGGAEVRGEIHGIAAVQYSKTYTKIPPYRHWICSEGRKSVSVGLKSPPRKRITQTLMFGLRLWRHVEGLAGSTRLIACAHMSVNHGPPRWVCIPTRIPTTTGNSSLSTLSTTTPKIL
jgi:hypothetical protein